MGERDCSLPVWVLKKLANRPVRLTDLANEIGISFSEAAQEVVPLRPIIYWQGEKMHVPGSSDSWKHANWKKQVMPLHPKAREVLDGSHHMSQSERDFVDREFERIYAELSAARVNSRCFEEHGYHVIPRALTRPNGRTTGPIPINQEHNHD